MQTLTAMQLYIYNQQRTLIPIREFREKHGLPTAFGIGAFEPKDYTGLGRIDHAGAELNHVRQSILEILPKNMPLRGWMAFIPGLRTLFMNKLYEINPKVGLKDVEIEFAVSGFSDVCEAVVWSAFRAQRTNNPAPRFADVYQEWLNNSVRVSQAVHVYTHKGDDWRIQIINNAYGRIGMSVETAKGDYYVHDPVLACPAEGYMASLLGEIAAHILA